MSDGNELIEEQVGRTLVLALNRVEVLNALNMRMLDALDAALHRADADESVRCIVLKGNGRAFCAGDDLRGVGFPGPNPSLDEELQHGHWRVINSMRTLTKPVIAALHGWAVGGGSDLALAADVRVADSTLRLGSPYMKRGMAGGVATIAGIVGLSVASDMLLTGRFMETEEGVARGVVHRVAPDGEAASVAIALAEEIAEGSASALSLTKRVLTEHWRRKVVDFLWADNYVAMVAEQSAEQREGVAAFLEKRHPAFEA